MRRLMPRNLRVLKMQSASMTLQKNYNVIINGHGTGLRPPTETEWEQLQNRILQINSAKFVQSQVQYGA